MTNPSYSTINSLNDFTVIGGNDFTIKFNVVDEDGLPVDLTGATLTLKISPYGQPTSVLETITGSIGSTDDIAEFILSADVSEQMIGGKYSYQPIIEDSSGKIHRPKQGTFGLIQAIGSYTDLVDVPSATYYVYGTGTNNYSATNAYITAYFEGLAILFSVQNANTTASDLTLSAVFGTKNIKKLGLSGSKSNLQQGDLIVGKKYFLVYDGTDWINVGLQFESQISLTIYGWTAETSLLDADEIGFLKASVAYLGRKITWANIKATLTTAFNSIYATLASPTLTGTPAAPTASVGTNTTQIATTAFVLANRKDLTNSSASVTTANITGVVNTRHILDISGMTANRNIVLPSGTAGDSIEIIIATGDDTYKLGIIGNTGVTINGGTSATLYRYMKRKNEIINLVLTSSTNWKVVYSSLEESAVAYSSASSLVQAVSLGSAEWVKVTTVFDTSDDVQGWWSDVNKRFTLPIGKYQVTGSIVASDIADQSTFLAMVYKNGSQHRLLGRTSQSGTGLTGTGGSTIVESDGDDYFEIYVFSSDLTYNITNNAILGYCHFDIIKLCE